jgi:ATP/maltotriose-dependent transcriptional regulator MalT
LRVLETEHDDLQAALTWYLDDKRDIAAGAKLALALSWFWYLRAYLAEGRRWLETVSGQDASRLAADVRLQAQGLAGFFAQLQGDLDVAARLGRSAATSAEQQPARHGRCLAMALYALTLRDKGRYASAANFLRRAIRGWTEANDRWGMAAGLLWLGTIYHQQGHAEHAQRLFARSLQLSDGLGDAELRAKALMYLGDAEFACGSAERGRSLIEESLRLLRALHADLGAAWSLAQLGDVMYAQGKQSSAASAYTEALRLGVRLGGLPAVAVCLEGLAELAAHGGHVERSVLLIGAADGIRLARGAASHPRRRHVRERVLEQGRHVLGETGVLSTFHQGRNLSMAEVLHSTLEPSIPGGHDQPGADASKTITKQLTPREREVVSLLVRGLTTNRQIAQALVITEGTAARHIENILDKLGLHARAQIVALTSIHSD